MQILSLLPLQLPPAMEIWGSFLFLWRRLVSKQVAHDFPHPSSQNLASPLFQQGLPSVFPPHCILSSLLASLALSSAVLTPTALLTLISYRVLKEPKVPTPCSSLSTWTWLYYVIVFISITVLLQETPAWASRQITRLYLSVTSLQTH